MPSLLSTKVDVPKRSFISTAALTAGGDSHVYSYTRTYDAPSYTWNGSLSPIDFTVAPYSTYNAPGVIFRETGKKLYAGANPGVDRLMVGVYIDRPNVDVGEMGTMYIDPNCSVFALFNGDRPSYIPTAIDDHESVQDLGNSVYTLGNITTTQGDLAVSAGTITASGNITTTAGNIAASAGTITASGNITSTAGNIAASAGGITALRAIRSSTVSAITPGANVVVDPALGQVFTLSINTGVTTNVTAATPNNVPGQVIYLIVTGGGAGSAIDFNAGFRSQSAGQLTINAAIVSFTFVSDGTNFYEVARTGALTQ